MKKIMIILLVIFTVIVGGVKAKTNDTTVKVNYLENVYGNFLIGDLFYWNQIGLTYANDKLAYCIEPGKWINETTYDSFTDFKVKNLTDTDKHKLELYAYYGYQYKGHNTVKYYLATQELIWRYLGIKEMYWSTNGEHNGDKINVENEKNIINNLIKKHNDLPSFHNETFEGISGRPIDLVDTNNVLEDFDFVYPVYHTTSKGGNKLTVIPNKVGDDTIKLLKYSNDYKTSFIYTKNDSQAIATLGLTNKIYSQFKIKVKGYKFELHKKDRITNGSVPSGEGTLKGAVYELTNNLDYKEELITDENGNASLDFIPAGNYILKEIKPSRGYKLDPNEYQVILNKDTNLEVSMDVFEDVITNDIELIKVYSAGETGIIQPENNIIFGIYKENGDFVKEITTDSKGRARTTLEYGTYRITQVNTTPNYERVEDFTIFVDENNNKPYEYILSDTLINSRIKIIKTDEFSNPIKKEGTEFKIKNIDTNKYVEQKITYPEEKIIDTFITNKNGVVTTPYPLTAGNYQIEEVKAPEGYLISEIPTYFSINENTVFEKDDIGKIFEIKIINKKPMAKVIVDKKGNKTVWNIDNTGKFYQSEILEPLTGVEFQLMSDEDIYNNGSLVYKNSEVIDTLITKDGVATSMLLPLGKYCVLETKTLDGYQINNNKQCFNLKYIDEKTELIEQKLEYINKYINTNIEIIKTGEEMFDIKNNKGVYKTKSLENVEFGLFTNEDITINNYVIKKDTELLKQVTDEMGKLNFNNIPIGNYYVKELKTVNNYIKDDKKYDLKIDNKNPYQKLELKNKKKKGNIIINKFDKYTKQVLSNALFQFKTKNNNYEYITDYRGVILLENIEYGNYILEELKAPNGYQRVNLKKDIKVNQDLIKVNISNIKYDMPNTSTDTKIKLYFIGCILIVGLLGIVITIITKKRYE